ncbi:MAG: nucleotide exchange factor GrpE [Myxococcaceae bacterium]
MRAWVTRGIVPYCLGGRKLAVGVLAMRYFRPVTSEKGNFSADISDAAIREALKSVEKHEAHDEVDVPIDADAPKVDASPPAQISDELAQLQAQLELSQAKGRESFEKYKDAHERLLRASADLDNYRKRAAKEKDEAQRFGTERLLKDLLPVVDNLERALAHAAANTDFKSLSEGVQMTRKLFEDVLGKHGVRGFSALGQPFDPRLHEAMGQEEAKELPPNHVTREILKGFWLHERLVRPALVMVSKAKEVSSAPPEPAAEGEEKET